MTWLPQVGDGDAPIYRRIADALETDIAAGRLVPGARLPAQRALAQKLGIDLTTVTRGYAEAARRGLIVGEGRRGSFVRARTARVDESAWMAQELASGMNMPPEPDTLRERIAAGVAAMLTRPLAPLHYQPSGGTEAQRAAAAAYFSGFVGDTVPDQMVVSGGNQNAIHAILSLIIRPGDRIAAPALTYPGFLAVARRMGVEICPVAIDAHGILPDSLEAICRAGPVRALYVVPTIDSPTAATLGEDRRRAIAAMADRHGFAIIEDDPYGRLPADPPPPIARFAPGCTWHLFTASKLLSPSFRVGLVRAPTVRDAHALGSMLHETLGMAPPINASLLAEWLDDGSYLRLFAALRSEAAARMSEAALILAPWRPRYHPEGYHLWLELPDGIDPASLSAQAAGLPIVPGHVFAAMPDAAVPAIRIALGGSASRPAIARGLRRLDALLAQAGRAALV